MGYPQESLLPLDSHAPAVCQKNTWEKNIPGEPKRTLKDY